MGAIPWRLGGTAGRGTGPPESAAVSSRRAGFSASTSRAGIVASSSSTGSFPRRRAMSLSRMTSSVGKSE